MSKSKTILEWLNGLSVDINNTVSKKANGAFVKESFRSGVKGFADHGLKIANVRNWALAEVAGVTYRVVVHVPKAKEGAEPVAKTFYQKVA